MKHSALSRREILALAGGAMALPVVGVNPAQAQQAQTEAPKDSAEALQRLKEGNRRFAERQTHHAHAGADWRKHLVGGQQPFATILGCSDSRVPTELVFDQGFGDLFVIRVAGNVISPDVVGSLAYAVEHLQTHVIVVVGHQGCGAVTAAVAAREKETHELDSIRALVELIQPGLPKILFGDSHDEKIEAAVEANVRWSIRQLAQLPSSQIALAKNKILLVGAVYNLETGRVRFLDA